MMNEFDTVAQEKEERNRTGVDLVTLNRAKHNWDQMSDFRKEGRRCHDFVNGKQWEDIITYEGKTMTERQALILQGFVPRTSNLLNRVIKNVTGVVLKNGNEPTAYSIDGNEQGICDVFNVLLQANNTLNRTKILWPQQFKQFLEWAAIIAKVEYGYLNGRQDNWIENIDPNAFFCDTGTMDVRSFDCDMVGMIHEIPLDRLLSNFAIGKPKDAHRKHEWLCEVYRKCSDRRFVTGTFVRNFGRDSLRNNVDFLIPRDPDKCRVIEVWTKERRDMYYVHDPIDGSLTIIKPDEYDEFVEEENKRRIDAARATGVSDVDIQNAIDIVDDPITTAKEGLTMPESVNLRIPEYREERYWYYRFLAPTGEVIEEGESPFLHKGHPFVFTFYPFVNGEVRSFIADLLPAQKNLNRNLTMHDMSQRISMKGFTVYDMNSLPDDDPDGERLMSQVAQPGGTYGFKLKPGEQIQNKVVQITSNNVGADLMNMIQMDKTDIEDMSGVNGALQGKPGYSTLSGSLYQQQANNATSSLLDVIESYYSFMMDCAYKQCSNMFQYYDRFKVEKIAGKGSYETIQKYIDTMNSDSLELDFKMLESPSSPVYRQVANDYLQSWLQMGLIDFPTMLKIGNFSFSDKLQAAIDKQNEMLAASGQETMPTMIPQQGNQAEASIAGIRAANAGAGDNMYNRMAQSKQG